MLPSIIAVCVGAALGALARWGLSLALNGMHPAIPPGTLVANLVGGYLVGLAVAFFAQHPELSPEYRLFAITGFLGGLTTFSTFSAEVTTLLEQGRLLAASIAATLHLGGSVAMTFLGLATWAVLTRL